MGTLHARSGSRGARQSASELRVTPGRAVLRRLRCLCEPRRVVARVPPPPHKKGCLLFSLLWFHATPFGRPAADCPSARSITLWKRRADCISRAPPPPATLTCSSVQNPLVTELSLFDIAGTPGVAADVSHINTAAQVKVRAPLRFLCCHFCPKLRRKNSPSPLAGRGRKRDIFCFPPVSSCRRGRRTATASLLHTSQH
jgi:hypothetical protein